jgi:peptidoglycan/LPS O-acetylase OafA/YrhL
LWAGLAIATLGAALTVNSLVALTGLTTALLIGFATIKGRILSFLGQISYSLYLVHFPVGVRLINFSSYYSLSAAGKAGALSASLAASIVAAYLLYLLVEKPAQVWSKSVRFKSTGEYLAPVEEQVRVLS